MERSEILALVRLLDRMDYYRLLRLDRKASMAKIRQAFHEARRRYHPDGHLDADPELREAVDRIATRITEAYTVLRTSAKRTAYDQVLGNGALRLTADAEESRREEVTASRQGATPNGRRFFAQAEAELRRGDLARAIKSLKTALTFEPANASFRERLADMEKRLAG